MFPYVVHDTHAVCLLDPQFNIWKSAAEFRQDPRQQIGSRDGGRGYDHSARSLLRRLLERVFNFFREFNDVFCVNINLFAGLCQGDFFCRSVKELFTQFAFQLAYVRAHSRLSQIKFFGGQREAFIVRDHDECFQLFKIQMYNPLFHLDY